MAGSKVALSERPERGKGQWILLGILLIAILVGGVFFGFFIDTTVINPPAQVLGTCPSPAIITGNTCVQRVCVTNTNQAQVCNYEPAGTVGGQP